MDRGELEAIRDELTQLAARVDRLIEQSDEVCEPHEDDAPLDVVDAPIEEPYFDGVHPYPVAPPRSKSQQSMAGRIGAHRRWAKEQDRSAATQAARDGMLRRFEDEVDPDRVLPADERAKRVENARTAYYTHLAMKSAKARRKRGE